MNNYSQILNRTLLTSKQIEDRKYLIRKGKLNFGGELFQSGICKQCHRKSIHYHHCVLEKIKSPKKKYDEIYSLRYNIEVPRYEYRHNSKNKSLLRWSRLLMNLSDTRDTRIIVTHGEEEKSEVLSIGEQSWTGYITMELVKYIARRRIVNKEGHCMCI